MNECSVLNMNMDRNWLNKTMELFTWRGAGFARAGGYSPSLDAEQKR